MNKVIVIDLQDKPTGYVESLLGFIEGYNRTDVKTYAELGSPKVRKNDGENASMFRFRRTDMERVCAELCNPVFDRDKMTCTFEVIPYGPFAHLLERFFDDVTLGARMSQRRGVVETISHFDIIPRNELKEYIDASIAATHKRTRAARGLS
jgi:hypothetical protein